MIWVGRLISIAILLQTIEMFWVTPWDWKIVSAEIPRPVRFFLRSNHFLLCGRLIAAVIALIFPHPVVIGILLFTTWAIAVRWRGTFNGGSDAMTFQILLAWFFSACFPQHELWSIFYITAQLVLSYFVAGLSKFSNREWRQGRALRHFIAPSGLQISESSAQAFSGTLIFFEMLFPLALLTPGMFIGAAILFHLANVFVFGLNRFFFAWLAAYPALVLTSRYILGLYSA